MEKELKFKPKSRWREFLGEKFISINAFAALIAILLIFIFIFKEAVPIFTDSEIKQEASLDKQARAESRMEREKGVLPQPGSEEDPGSLHQVATVLLRDYLLPFEVASILLLVALVGAIVLAQEVRKRSSHEP